MNNDELRELVHLLLMCGIMDKTATESGNVTDEEWLRMKNLIKQYQTEGGINCEPDKSGDLISRSYLKNLPFERVIHTDFGDTAIPIEEIDNAPTVELFCSYLSDGEVRQPCVEGPCEQDRPTGKWIRKVDEVGFISHICSECGAEIEVEDPRDDKFCFNCGAKMKGGAE